MGRVMRRSGNAVLQTCQCINWRPDVLWQVGVGVHHEEVDCLLEEWPKIRIVGFEPHPTIYDKIKDNYPGILVNKAVTDTEGGATLYSKPRHKDGSSLFKYSDEGNNKKPMRVSTTFLDNQDSLDLMCTYLNIGETRHLLWLDCEGSENLVLRGAGTFLKHINAINIEMTGVPLGDDWATPLELHRTLASLEMYAQMIHTNRIMSGQYDALYVRKRLFNPNHCNCPSEVARYFDS